MRTTFSFVTVFNGFASFCLPVFGSNFYLLNARENPDFKLKMASELEQRLERDFVQIASVYWRKSASSRFRSWI
jgi:fucose permease